MEEEPERFNSAAVVPISGDPIAVMQAYRDNIADPVAAWAAARAVVRAANPGAPERAVETRAIVLLGAPELVGSHASDLSRNGIGGVPCLINGPAALRIDTAARHYGMTANELVSRIVSAWIVAACDFDGVPDPAAPPPATNP